MDFDLTESFMWWECGAVVASGFLLDEEDSVAPWRTYVRTSRADAYALKADPQSAFLARDSHGSMRELKT